MDGGGRQQVKAEGGWLDAGGGGRVRGQGALAFASMPGFGFSWTPTKRYNRGTQQAGSGGGDTRSRAALLQCQAIPHISYRLNCTPPLD